MIRLKRWFHGRQEAGKTAPEQEPLASSSGLAREAEPIAEGSGTDPDDVTAHYNLGNALREQGKLDEALASYRMAASLRPDFADAHNNAGLVLQTRGDLDEAAESYERAIACNPDHAIAHNNLGNVLSELRQFDSALASYQRALELSEMPEFKANFVRCIRNCVFARVDDGIRRLVVRALSVPWAWKSQLTRPATRLIKSDPKISACIDRAANAWPRRLTSKELFGRHGLTALSSDLLLRTLLETAPVDDLAMERCLTLVRQTVLDAASSPEAGGDPASETLAFFSALSRQCFINEYIFSCTEEELARATALRDELAAALRFGRLVPALWIVAVAAYFPLLSIAAAEALLDRSYPDTLEALLAQQIAEPLEEQRDRASIPRLTAVDAGVSSSVRQQYEENPYPRWVRSPRPDKAVTIDAYLRRLFPLASFCPVGKSHDLDVLVAGCGTGGESIRAAQEFAGAQVLAIDLSLSSLCYAKRKTREIGLKNIEYAQADITKLESIGRRFDVISAVGVLHHLAEPIAGLRVLLSLLRPGGFMRLGLYSESARQAVVAGRRFIAEEGYTSTAEDIRQCRQELLDRTAQFAGLTKWSDFYTTSECRDLLFHVQEHRFTLPQVKVALRDAGLDLIGFTVDHNVASEYDARFPDDKARTNLDYWHRFETEFPDTFASMYDFWAQMPRPT